MRSEEAKGVVWMLGGVVELIHRIGGEVRIAVNESLGYSCAL